MAAKLTESSPLCFLIVEPGRALNAVLKGEVLPTPGFDPTRLLCRLRDLFSPH